jgi:hypothetical protein
MQATLTPQPGLRDIERVQVKWQDKYVQLALCRTRSQEAEPRSRPGQVIQSPAGYRV